MLVLIEHVVTDGGCFSLAVKNPLHRRDISGSVKHDYPVPKNSSGSGLVKSPFLLQIVNRDEIAGRARFAGKRDRFALQILDFIIRLFFEREPVTLIEITAVDLTREQYLEQYFSFCAIDHVGRAEITKVNRAVSEIPQ